MQHVTPDPNNLCLSPNKMNPGLLEPSEPIHQQTHEDFHKILLFGFSTRPLLSFKVK